MYVNAASDIDLRQMIDIVISKHAMAIEISHALQEKRTKKWSLSASQFWGSLLILYTF